MKIQNMQQNNFILLRVKQKAFIQQMKKQFLTRSIESSLCDYSDAYILVTGNITSGRNDTKAAFKNCAPFRTCITQIKFC